MQNTVRFWDTKGTIVVQKQPSFKHSVSGLITRLCCVECFLPFGVGNCGCLYLGYYDWLGYNSRHFLYPFRFPGSVVQIISLKELNMNLGVRVDTRIKENLKKYQNQLLRLQELDAKEPPTEKVAMDMLCDVFGYDLEHVFGQYGTNGRACDAVIKDDKKVFYVFECKRIGVDKKEFHKHVRQVIEYCSTLNVSWGILTNGAYWQLYYVDVKAQPVTATLVWDFDVLELSHRQSAHRELLLPLCREAISKRLKESILEEKQALSTDNLARVLLSDEVLKAISGVLKRKVGAKVDIDVLESKIRELCPNLPENIRGFRASKKKDKPARPEIKVVAVNQEGNLAKSTIGLEGDK